MSYVLEAFDASVFYSVLQFHQEHGEGGPIPSFAAHLHRPNGLKVVECQCLLDFLSGELGTQSFNNKSNGSSLWVWMEVELCPFVPEVLH